MNQRRVLVIVTMLLLVLNFSATIAVRAQEDFQIPQAEDQVLLFASPVTEVYTQYRGSPEYLASGFPAFIDNASEVREFLNQLTSWEVDYYQVRHLVAQQMAFDRGISVDQLYELNRQEFLLTRYSEYFVGMSLEQLALDYPYINFGEELQELDDELTTQRGVDVNISWQTANGDQGCLWMWVDDDVDLAFGIVMPGSNCQDQTNLHPLYVRGIRPVKVWELVAIIDAVPEQVAGR